jgi:heterodisulfide reductase subunit D
MFVGCTGSYDPLFRSVTTGTATILKKIGVDFGILGKKEKCCSGTVFRIGERERFEKLKKKTADSINELECKTVVTACAGCSSTFHTEYSGDLEPEVLHSVEFLDKLLQEGKLKFTKEVKKRVTYHDPCHVGRYAGIFEAPRNILKAIPGLELIEMERIKEHSRCCGAGGGVRAMNPEFATWCAKERLEEARDATGTDTLVSCCPFCESNLREASKGYGFGIEVVDVMDLVAMASE